MTTKSKAGEALDLNKSRAEFEAWARDPVRAEKLPLDRWPANDGYKDSRTYIAFYGFKAGRAARARAPAAPFLDENDGPDMTVIDVPPGSINGSVYEQLCAAFYREPCGHTKAALGEAILLLHPIYDAPLDDLSLTLDACNRFLREPAEQGVWAGDISGLEGFAQFFIALGKHRAALARSSLSANAGEQPVTHGMVKVEGLDTLQPDPHEDAEPNDEEKALLDHHYPDAAPASAAPVSAAPAAPTELSKRLRTIAAGVSGNNPAMVTPQCLIDAADEIDRLAAPAATAEPTAWPVEPTNEMQAAGAAAIRFDTTVINKMWTANAVYRAMRAVASTTQHVSAAPAVPTEQHRVIRRAANLLKARGFPELHDELKAILAAPTAAEGPSDELAKWAAMGSPAKSDWEEGYEDARRYARKLLSGQRAAAVAGIVRALQSAFNWSDARAPISEVIRMVRDAAPLPTKEGAGEVDAKDAGALDIACAVNRKLGNALLGRSYLLPDDLVALKRFEECASDFDSGGHDVPKLAMARLREIGVVQSIGFGRHQTTAFGDYVLERAAGEPVNLPLMTLAERNAAAAIAAQPKDTTDTRRDA